MATRPISAADPARSAHKVTKADETLPNGPCRALWVGSAGTANLIDLDGNTLTDFPLIAGPNPIGVQQVSEGGDADDIWALY